MQSSELSVELCFPKPGLKSRDYTELSSGTKMSGSTRRSATPKPRHPSGETGTPPPRPTRGGSRRWIKDWRCNRTSKRLRSNPQIGGRWCPSLPIAESKQCKKVVESH